jgi:hypothetical protein
LKKPRVSIAGLMILVLLVAFGFAALKNPSQLVAGLAFMLAMGMLLLALVGMAFGRGGVQIHLAGFAVFGWGYLILVLSTGDLPLPTLPSSMLVAYLSQVMLPPKPTAMNATGGTFLVARMTGRPEIVQFLQIGHSLATLLVALLGSWLAGAFAKREAALDHSDSR